MLRNLGCLIMMLGLFLLMATCGGSDTNVIAIPQIIVQMLLSFGLLGLGGFVVNRNM